MMWDEDGRDNKGRFDDWIGGTHNAYTYTWKAVDDVRTASRLALCHVSCILTCWRAHVRGGTSNAHGTCSPKKMG